jgi:hypothetical protein
MILEAAGDVKHAERTLRDIDLLNHQGAGGAGSLEREFIVRLRSRAQEIELLPYRGELIKGLVDNRARSKEMSDLRKQVGDLLRRYNEFVSPMWMAEGTS